MKAGEEVKPVSSLAYKTPAAVRHETLTLIIHVSQSPLKFVPLHGKPNSQKSEMYKKKSSLHW